MFYLTIMCKIIAYLETCPVQSEMVWTPLVFNSQFAMLRCMQNSLGPNLKLAWSKVGTSTGGKVSHSTELTAPSPSAETKPVRVTWVFISCNRELTEIRIYCIISLCTVRWWTRRHSFYPSVCINRNTAIRVSNIPQFKFIRHTVLYLYGLAVTDFCHSIQIVVLERLILRLPWVSFIYYTG